MSKNNEYQPGNPEYDYWNDKNLYSSLRNVGDDLRTSQPVSSEDAKVGIGSVFLTFLIWILIFAPFALFLTWENRITQIIFWGGLAIIVLVFIAWIFGAAKE